MLACVLIPNFAAQVEQEHAPTRAPLLLITGERPVIAASDAQAEAWGVQRGMPIKRARALCPDAEIRPLVELHLRRAFEVVLEIINDYASRFEVQSPTGGSDPAAWLDLGTVLDVATVVAQVQRAIYDHVRLRAGVGLATGKFPAFAAALTGGVNVLPAGGERAFLAPLPVTLLPLLPDERRRLGLYGLHTLGLLAALPRAAVMAQFGMRGRLLHQLSCGEDPRPLNPYQPPPVEHLGRRFEEPLADEAQFHRTLRDLAAEGCTCLQDRGAACQRVVLALAYENGEAVERAHALRESVSAERDLFHTLMRLSVALPHAGVIALDLELSDLVAEQPRQLRLFDEQGPTRRTSHQVARSLRPRHGSAPFVATQMPEEAAPMPDCVAFAPLEDT